MGNFIPSLGMEELLVMAESGKYSKSGWFHHGHLDRTDAVYPLGNTECLCEVKSDVSKLFQILAQEMNYTTIVLNLGSRFMGFLNCWGAARKFS